VKRDDSDNCPTRRRNGFANSRRAFANQQRRKERGASQTEQPYRYLDLTGRFHLV
jgi:hypothetical protein